MSASDAPDDAQFPEWLLPVVQAAREITVHELTHFMPPEGGDPRRGAVLIVFSDTDRDGEGEILLTERAHGMRSHPGQVSFPGGSLDPGETPVQAALREAQEEIAVDPESLTVFGELPELWLPPSNFAVTPVLAYWSRRHEVEIASPAEVHEIHHVPISELLDPQHRIGVRHPRGFTGPGFLIGADHDVILWGFTAGIIARLFDFVGWTREWDKANVRDLPDHMLQGDPAPSGDVRPNTRLSE